jgi:hypothetical protein
VVGGFYGPAHSREWWLGAVLSTAIPVIYAFTGGMRASIMTDAAQARRPARLLCAEAGLLPYITPTLRPAGPACCQTCWACLLPNLLHALPHNACCCPGSSYYGVAHLPGGRPLPLATVMPAAHAVCCQ